MSDDANPTPDAGADLSIEERIEATLDYETPQDDQVKPDNQPEEDVIEDAIEDTESEVSEEEELLKEEAKEYESEAEYFADKLGLDVNKFKIDESGQLLFNAKVDGEDSQVKFDDLVKSYQLDKHINNKSQALSETQKQFETQKQAAEQQLLTQLQQANELVGFAESQLSAEFNSINWQALREADPAEYTARRQDYAEKAQQLQQVKEQAGSQLQVKQQEAQEAQAKQFSGYVEEQMQELTTKLPEWSDQTVKAKEIGEINSFLSSQYGFEDNILSSVYDHRLYILGRDAMKANKVKQATNEKIKKPVPKFQKPGTTTRKSDQVEVKNKKKLNQFKKTGSQSDLHAVLLDRI